MEDERDGDLRVPLISSLFFILVFAGGCCGRALPYSYDHQVSRRVAHPHPVTPRHSVVANQTKAMSRSRSTDVSPKVSCSSNNVGSRHVHFGEVVVVESDGSKVVHEVDSWTNSTKAIEMEPLNAS